MRSDLDQFFGHDDGAVEKREISDNAATILLNSERASGINRDVIAKHHRTRFFADELFKNLRTLTVKSFAELYVARNRLWVPIVFHTSIFLDVAHVGNFPEVNSLA